MIAMHPSGERPVVPDRTGRSGPGSVCVSVAKGPVFRCKADFFGSCAEVVLQPKRYDNGSVTGGLRPAHLACTLHVEPHLPRLLTGQDGAGVLPACPQEGICCIGF